MIDHNRRVRLADELLRRFASALRGAQLYAASHPLVARNTDAFFVTIGLVIGQQRSLTLGVVGGEFVVGDVPLPRSSGTMGDLMRRLQRLGVERVVIDRDVTSEERDLRGTRTEAPQLGRCAPMDSGGVPRARP